MGYGGERRTGIFYKTLTWKILGGAFALLVSLATLAYNDLSARLASKVDREEFKQALEALREMRVDIRDIRNWIMPGRTE